MSQLAARLSPAVAIEGEGGISRGANEAAPLVLLLSSGFKCAVSILCCQRPPPSSNRTSTIAPFGIGCSSRNFLKYLIARAFISNELCSESHNSAQINWLWLKTATVPLIVSRSILTLLTRSMNCSNDSAPGPSGTDGLDSSQYFSTAGRLSSTVEFLVPQVERYVNS